MNSTARFSAVLIGALLCLAIQISLTVLGSGIGIAAIQNGTSAIDPKSIGIGAGIFFILVTLITFFVGGYFAARLSDQRTKFGAVAHGLGVWSLVSVGLILFVGSNAVSSMSGLLTKAGLGVGGAVGLETTLEKISELNPRIVSDMKILKGKIVSRVLVDKPKGNLAGSAVDEAKETAQAVSKKAGIPAKSDEIVEDVKKAAAGASLAAFFALFAGAIASAWGSILARKHVVRTPLAPAASQPTTRIAA